MKKSSRNAAFSFRLRHLLAVFVALSILLCLLVLDSRLPTKQIAGEEISQEQRVLLSVNPDDYDYITYLGLEIAGNIDGKATLVFPWGEERAVGPGEFRFKISGSHDSETATILYRPVKVKDGRIIIWYDFLQL